MTQSQPQHQLQHHLQPPLHPQLSLNRAFLPTPSKKQQSKSLSHQLPHSAPPPTTEQINNRAKLNYSSSAVRRSTSNTSTLISNNNPNHVQRRHSRFNNPRRPIPDSSTLWYDMTLRLTQLPTLHVIIISFSPRTRRAARRLEHTFCLLHSSAMSGRAWGPVGGARPLADVLTLTCSPNELRTRGLRVSVFQHGRGVRATQLGVAFFRVSDFIIPPRNIEHNSNSTPCCTPVLASVTTTEDVTDALTLPANRHRQRDTESKHKKSSVGTLEVRAVVAPLRPVESIYALDILIRNGMSMKKELRGCSVVILRTCPGMNIMPIAESIIEKNGDQFAEIKIPRAVLWFGIEEEMKAKIGIRLEWVRSRYHGILGTGLKGKENRHCLGQLDVNVEKIEGLKQSEMLPVSWKEAPNIMAVNRLAVVDNTQFSDNRLNLQVTLTR